MTRKTTLAIITAATYTAIITLLTIYFVNNIWPTLPPWAQLIGFILVAFFFLAPPYAYLVKRSNAVLKDIQNKREGKENSQDD